MVFNMEMEWCYLAAESMSLNSLMLAIETYMLLSKSLIALMKSGLRYEAVCYHPDFV